ncbi:MAG: hypothetical protein DWI02_07010 [Planctomycetota bacterium]|nr:MAG: hypothetical protein DWI02_07010 [Planctomycetota bacterium]
MNYSAPPQSKIPIVNATRRIGLRLTVAVPLIATETFLHLDGLSAIFAYVSPESLLHSPFFHGMILGCVCRWRRKGAGPHASRQRNDEITTCGQIAGSAAICGN